MKRNKTKQNLRVYTTVLKQVTPSLPFH